MLTLLGSLLGFAGSIFPELFKYLRDKQDHAQELAIMQLQMQYSKDNASERLEEIVTNGDTEQQKALLTTYNVGIKWVDAFNATVRPTLAYAFFILYAICKIVVMLKIQEFHIMPLSEIFAILWNDSDGAIFAGIISFYFGNRSFQKLRG